MEKTQRIDGYYFRYDREGHFYECRGDVCYDDEHDETAEPGLWQAALKLEKILEDEGHRAEADYSEKGWVEVNITSDPKGYIIK